MTVLVEYDSTLTQVHPSDLNYLLELVRSNDDERRVLRAITPTRTADLYELVAGAFVGRLGLPSGAWLDFRSRFPFHDVIELIRASTRLPIRVDALHVPGEADTFLVDAIAFAFAREVEALASRGLAKGYRSMRRLHPPYPGRLDIPYHLGHLGARPDRLVTIARHLTTDVPENQALALALDVLTRVALPPAASRRLAALASAFARVGRPPMRAHDVSRLPLNNMTARYAPALALAEAILRSQAMAPRSSGLAGASILFFMPTIWESFVAQWLQGEWPDHSVQSPYRFVMTNDGQHAEADATVWDGGALVALYDAKYKWPTSAPSRDDLYQMITYCSRLGLSAATLLYPASVEPRTVSVAEKRVHVRGINPATVGALRDAAEHVPFETRAGRWVPRRQAE